MNVPRVIPCLLLKRTGCIKTVRFGDSVYLGDPINIVKLFNDMEVDELGILDTRATVDHTEPQISLLSNIADNAFMPLSYGGGVRTLEHVRTILGIGYEKIILGHRAAEDASFVEQAASLAGSQSVVVSVDARRTLFGKYHVYTACGKTKHPVDPVTYAREMERRGAGEILLTAIDRDGTMSGYDLELIREVSSAVRIPVIASGGAGKLADCVAAVRQGGASAVAAGSLFVFHGRHRAVLVNFPSRAELEAAFAAAPPADGRPAGSRSSP